MNEFIETPLTVIHIICSLFLILVVLLQPGKGGGLGGISGAGAQQVFGGRGAGSFLTKTTWISAAIFFVTSATLGFMSTSSDSSLNAKATQYDVTGRGHLPTAPSSAPASSSSPAKK